MALIRAAKAEGLPVTCETGPHYLVLCDEDLEDDGRFRMNPPIRSAADRDALVEGLLDGTMSPTESIVWQREIREHSGADWLKWLRQHVGQYVVRVKH